MTVVIQPNGTLDLTDKTTGHTFRGLHYFADNGEAGHAWRHIPPCHDRVITTLRFLAHKSNGSNRAPASPDIAVTHTMDIPKTARRRGG